MVPVEVACAEVGLPLVTIGSHVSSVVAAGAAIRRTVATESTTETAPEWIQSVKTTPPTLVNIPAIYSGYVVPMLVQPRFPYVKTIRESRQGEYIAPRSIYRSQSPDYPDSNCVFTFRECCILPDPLPTPVSNLLVFAQSYTQGVI